MAAMSRPAPRSTTPSRYRDPRTIISLSLCESGLGNVEGARTLLASHIADLPAGDYGLAMAMAGDPREGVRALLEAVHAPDATVKTRQNLAYALAMAGGWGQARLIAGQDLAAKDAEARIGEWTRMFAQGSPSDRVVAMLGVSPRADDSGLPVQLALNAAPEQPVSLASVADLVQDTARETEAAPVALAAAAPVAEAMPVKVAEPAPAAKPVFGPEALAAILARAPAVTAPKADVALEPVELPSGVKPAPTPVPAARQAPAAAPIEILKAAFTLKPATAPAPMIGKPPLAPLQQAAPQRAFAQPAVQPAAPGRFCQAGCACRMDSRSRQARDARQGQRLGRPARRVRQREPGARAMAPPRQQSRHAEGL